MKEGDYSWEHEGDQVTDAIAIAAEIDEEPAEDIRKVLEDKHWNMEMGEEGPFDEDTHYTAREPDDIEYQENWRFFEDSLKAEARFFSSTADATLADVFEELADHRSPDGKPVIVQAGPETGIPALYRARVFQSSSALKDALKRPDLRMGPPPPALAKAGRMNAHGISVFYGATDPAVAIGEVRPPVGSRVAVGKFSLVRATRLLDVSALQSVYVEGSIFDPAHAPRLERAKFLESLGERIARPVMPDDEPLEYLITQVIADYLAGRLDPALDGILYPSVQDGTHGANVMLFHKASRVALFDIPEGTEIHVSSGLHSEDEWETDYRVWEEAPPSEPKDPKDENDTGLFDPSVFLSNPIDWRVYDGRETTLQLNAHSLKVHHIHAAHYAGKPYPVSRHRSERKVRSSSSKVPPPFQQ